MYAHQLFFNSVGISSGIFINCKLFKLVTRRKSPTSKNSWPINCRNQVLRNIVVATVLFVTFPSDTAPPFLFHPCLLKCTQIDMVSDIFCFFLTRHCHKIATTFYLRQPAVRSNLYLNKLKAIFCLASSVREKIFNIVCILLFT